MTKPLIQIVSEISSGNRLILLGIILLLVVSGTRADDSASLLAPPALEIEAIHSAELLTFSANNSNYDALFIKLDVGKDFLYFPPMSGVFSLYVGPFRGSLGYTIPVWLEETHRYRITAMFDNWEQLEEGAPMILTKLGGENLRPEEQQEFMTDKTPRFSHQMIVDKRGRVIRGQVAYLVEENKAYYVPNATVKVNGGDISVEAMTDSKGQFFLNEGDGVRLEEGEEYLVEVFVDGVVVLSQTVTKESSTYPWWGLVPERSQFSEINGYVYDTAGEPLAGVLLTAINHTATTDENGYYQLNHLVVGATYTLLASFEGYHFSPVELTVGEGQPDRIDIVESNPTQCLLYAIHYQANNKGQLFSADLSEEPFEVKPVKLTLPSHDVSIAVADFDGDDEDEIAVAAQQGGHTVTLYELDGTMIRSLSVQASGISLAAGDINGDNQPEIIVAGRAANRDSVFVYAADGTAQGSIALFDKNTRIAPAVGDIDGDDKADIIAGQLLKEDQVAVYNSTSHALNHFPVFQSRTRKDKPGKAYGVNVASADFNNDGKADVVAAMASKGSQIEVYESDGTLLTTLAAFDDQHGLVVAAGNVIDDQQPEIIVGEANGSVIRGFNLAGEQRFELKTVPHGTVSSIAVFRCP